MHSEQKRGTTRARAKSCRNAVELRPSTVKNSECLWHPRARLCVHLHSGKAQCTLPLLACAPGIARGPPTPALNQLITPSLPLLVPSLLHLELAFQETVQHSPLSERHTSETLRERPDCLIMDTRGSTLTRSSASRRQALPQRAQRSSRRQHMAAHGSVGRTDGSGRQRPTWKRQTRERRTPLSLTTVNSVRSDAR